VPVLKNGVSMNRRKISTTFSFSLQREGEAHRRIRVQGSSRPDLRTWTSLARSACFPALLLALGCSAEQSGLKEADRLCIERDAGRNCSLYGPSLVDLIVRPEQFRGKRVLVRGFVEFRFEGPAIYLSEGDCDHFVTRNGLWLQLRDGGQRLQEALPLTGGLRRGWAELEGTFEPGVRGHMNSWSGAVTDVTRVTFIPARNVETRPQSR